MCSINCYLQGVESRSEVKAGDKLTLLNAKPGSSSLEVIVSFNAVFYVLFFFCILIHCSVFMPFIYGRYKTTVFLFEF